MKRLMRPVVGGVAQCLGPAARGTKSRGWFYRALAAREAEAQRVEKPPYPEQSITGQPRLKGFLDDDIVPKTVENFTNLCAGSNEAGVGYKGTNFNVVQKGFMMSAGDFSEDGDGRGGHSALGSRYFDDENFVGRHSQRGVLSMANSGIDSNSSIFFITCKALKHLDGRNVVFGRVTNVDDGGLEAIENTFCSNGRPVDPVVIEDCGVLEADSASAEAAEASDDSAAAAAEGEGARAAAA